MAVERVCEKHYRRGKGSGAGWGLAEGVKGMILADTADTAWTKVKDRGERQGLRDILYEPPGRYQQGDQDMFLLISRASVKVRTLIMRNFNYLDIDQNT